MGHSFVLAMRELWRSWLALFGATALAFSVHLIADLAAHALFGYALAIF